MGVTANLQCSERCINVHVDRQRRSIASTLAPIVNVEDWQRPKNGTLPLLSAREKGERRVRYEPKRCVSAILKDMPGS